MSPEGEQFDQCSYCLQYRQPKNISRQEEHGKSLDLQAKGYCKFGIFREDFIFTKLRICEVLQK